MPPQPTDEPDPQTPSVEEAAEEHPDWKSMIAVLVVQAHNVFNDKISQFMLIGLAGVLVAKVKAGNLVIEGWELTAVESYKHICTTLMSLPFVLFAPLAGWLSDRYSKRTVLFLCMIIQISVLAWIVVCLQANALWWATLGFFVLAIQSTLLSPAKMGIAKELVGSHRLAKAIGLMQMLVIVSIIIGTIVGGQAFDNLQADYAGDDSGEWKAARIIAWVLLIAAVAPFFVLMLVKKTPVQDKQPFRPAILLRHFTHLAELFRRREMRLAAFGVTFFWFAGGMVQLTLILAGLEIHPDAKGALSATTTMWGFVGVGIALGNLTVSLVSKDRIELGLVPLGALGMAFGLTVSGIATNGSFFGNGGLFIMGVSSGMFLVPLNAYIQDLAESKMRGRIQSALNLLTAIAGIAAIGVQWVFEQQLGWGSATQFWVLAAMALGVAAYITQLLPRHFLRFIAASLVKCVYRVRPLNLESVPEEGGVLMISNHVSYADAFIISVACPRPVRFVIVDHYLKVKAFGWFLRIFDVIPIAPNRAKDAIRTTAEAINEGSVVCIFPEGQLTRTGMLNELKKGFELIARQAKAPVLPVFMDSLWGSIFSFERHRYFYKLPKRFPYPVTVNFGKPIPHDEVNNSSAREAIQDLSVAAFAEREDLRMSMGEAVVRGLKNRPSQELFIDVGKNRRVFKRGLVLTVAYSLAKRWRHWPDDEKRVGILLPPGAVAGIMNVALVLAKRVPVNLPIDLISKPAERERLMRVHGMRRVISSSALFQDGELPGDLVDMREEMQQLKPLERLFGPILNWLEPNWLAVRRMGLKKLTPDEEAVAFLSEFGDSGRQLVSLTHHNLLASNYQIDSSLVFLPNDKVFVESAFDEIAPMLLGLWHPVTKRGAVVFRSLAAQQYRASAVLAQEMPQIVLLSPRLVNELANEDQEIPASVVVFLDFYRQDLSEEQVQLLERAGAQYCPAFAPPQLGSIVSMNTKDPTTMIPSHLPQTGNKPGTVGRLMPGISARIVEGTEVKNLTETGSLLVRGSAFSHAEQRHVEIDGESWISTGVEASFDQEGFLTLHTVEENLDDEESQPTDEPS